MNKHIFSEFVSDISQDEICNSIKKEVIMDNTQTLLETLTKAVVFKFKDDMTAPGVTVSSLKNGKFYASVVRYNGAIATGKQVVCNATSDTLPGALQAVASKFLTTAQVTKNPVDELRDLVKGSK